MSQYLIVFGNVQEFLEMARRKPSEGVKLVPLKDKINDTYGKVNEDPLKILVTQEEQSSVDLMMFYPSEEAFKASVDKNSVPIMDLLTDDDDIGCIRYKVIGVAGELYCVEFDEEQIDAHDMIDHYRFPDNWINVELPLLTEDGNVKMFSEGTVNEIDTRMFDVRIFRWAKEVGIIINDMATGGNTKVDLNTLQNLPHLNIYTTDILNEGVMDHNPNARFTAYIRKDAKDHG